MYFFMSGIDVVEAVLGGSEGEEGGGVFLDQQGEQLKRSGNAFIVLGGRG